MTFTPSKPYDIGDVVESEVHGTLRVIMKECKHAELRRDEEDNSLWHCVEPKCEFSLRTMWKPPPASCLSEGYVQMVRYRPGPDSKMIEDAEGRFVFLKAVMELDVPWPVPEVLLKLADAAEHLLTQHGCDVHGHELIRTAERRAREILTNWKWPNAVEVDAVVEEIARKAYWKDDPPVSFKQVIHPPINTLKPEAAVELYDKIVDGDANIIDLTMKNDFISCNGCDTPNVCPQRGCGKRMRERLASLPECSCSIDKTTCLRHNSFVDNTPKQLGFQP